MTISINISNFVISIQKIVFHFARRRNKVLLYKSLATRKKDNYIKLIFWTILIFKNFDRFFITGCFDTK